MMILLLLGVAAAFFLQRELYRRRWYRRLKAEIVFADSFVYEGDTSCLKEEISNDKYLPVPALEVGLAMDRSLKFYGEAADNANVTDQSYRRDIFSLFMKQKIIRRLPFVCTKRGFYEIKEARLVAYDFFLKKCGYMEQGQKTWFYVYPGAVDVERIRLICQAVSGMVLMQSRLYPDPFEFAGIREYRPTDPMNHINWKASARNAGLLVNQFDSTTSIQVCILLDVQDREILRHENLTEEGIRITASLASKMVRAHMEVDVVSNGLCFLPGQEEKREQEPLSMHLKSGGGAMQELYRRLACMDISQVAEDVDGLLKKAVSAGRSGYIHVFISHDQDVGTIAGVRALAQTGTLVIWVLPLETSMELRVGEMPGVRILRWEVDGNV